MRKTTRSFALLTLLLLALLALPLVLPTTGATLPDVLPAALADEGDDEGEDGKKEGEDEGEPGADLGDRKVPFADQVNKAIELGVNWLWGKPKLFSIPGTDSMQGAHWGLVKGQKIYGGGQGPTYRHPAGPTALALYTLLKCGVSPKEHVIEKGFNWLRSFHRVTKMAESDLYDGTDLNGQERSWCHTASVSSYELSVMILALTAKYDAYKKTSASKVAKRKGKLKIKDRFDRAWLQQMVTALVQRRGQPTETPLEVDPTTMRKLSDPLEYDDQELPVPTDLPEREHRLGWRYNAPHLNLVVVRKKGRSTSRQECRRQVRIPPHANQDMSSTQLAVLALFSAQRFGVKIPSSVWTDVIEFTLSHQEETGPEHKRHVPGYIPDRYGPKEFVDRARGFMYIKGSPDNTEGIATGSMTACGVANLLIAREMIAKDKKARERFVESGVLKKVDRGIYDGLAWLDRNWSAFTNTRSRYGYHIYYLYCVERAMDLLNKRLIGRRLWYPAGAKEILRRAKPQKVAIKLKKKGMRSADGVYWMTNATHDPKDVLDTCFALLYLKRATKDLVPGGVITGEGGAPADNR